MRGWYRQSDFPQNELLYDSNLGGKAYRAWLRKMAVRYVLLTDAPADYSSRREAALLRSGKSGLVPVKYLQHMTVYELPDATPLVTGPGGATVLWLWPQRLVATVGAAGHVPRAHPLVAVLARVDRLRLAHGRRADEDHHAGDRARRAALRRQRHARAADARRYDPGMLEDARSLTDQLEELGAQLDWVREYL